MGTALTAWRSFPPWSERDRTPRSAEEGEVHRGLLVFRKKDLSSHPVSGKIAFKPTNSGIDDTHHQHGQYGHRAAGMAAGRC